MAPTCLLPASIFPRSPARFHFLPADPDPVESLRRQADFRIDQVRPTAGAGNRSADRDLLPRRQAMAAFELVSAARTGPNLDLHLGPGEDNLQNARDRIRIGGIGAGDEFVPVRQAVMVRISLRDGIRRVQPEPVGELPLAIGVNWLVTWTLSKSR